QRDEDLARVGDDVAVALVAQPRRGGGERRQVVAIGKAQRFRGGEKPARFRRTERRRDAGKKRRRDAGKRRDRGHERSSSGAGSMGLGAGLVTGSATLSVTPASASKAQVRVGEAARMKIARSSGVSMSSAMPGRRRMRGANPALLAASRWGRKLSLPKASGTASGGVMTIAFEPRPSWAGTMLKPGSWGWPATSMSISAQLTRATSPPTAT